MILQAGAFMGTLVPKLVAILPETGKLNYDRNSFSR
jgi:hypothetical protein